jgi:hypothetical protein
MAEKRIQAASGENQIQMSLDHLDAGNYIIEILELDGTGMPTTRASKKMLKM